MNTQELVAQAIAMLAEGDSTAPVTFLYREYEKTVDAIRKAREGSETSTGTKLVLESLTFTDAENDAAEVAMTAVRTAVYDAVYDNPRVAILLYDALKDYASNEIKDYRDDLLAQAKRGLTLPVEDVEIPDVTSDELAAIRDQALAFWSIAGSPKMERVPLTDENGNPVDETGEPTDDPKEYAFDPFSPATKENKGGRSLSFSKLPKNLSASENTERATSTDNTRHSRLRYSVDGTVLPVGTSLNTVALWHLSTPDWTMAVEDVRTAVAKANGKFNNTDDFTVTINGHTLKRYRENV